MAASVAITRCTSSRFLMLIHVTCPSCAEPYDIADTFAGGVYRCTKCNTLMSVPKPMATPNILKTAPGMGKKSLSPDEVEFKEQSSTSQTSGSRTGSKTVSKPVAKAKPKPGAKGAAQKSLWDLYKVHFISIGVFVVLALVALVVINSIKSTPKKEITKEYKTIHELIPSPAHEFAYAQGFLTNAKPNVLGLPLTGNVAVIIDGGSELNPARTGLHQLLIGGLSNKPFDLKASVVYGNGLASASPVSPIKDTAALAAFLGKVDLSNAGRESIDKGLIPALNAAIAGIPANTTQHIVVILGRKLTPYMQTKLVTAAEAAVNSYSTHLDVIVVNADISEMDTLGDLAAKSHGRMLRLTTAAINDAAAAAK